MEAHTKQTVYGTANALAAATVPGVGGEALEDI